MKGWSFISFRHRKSSTSSSIEKSWITFFYRRIICEQDRFFRLKKKDVLATLLKSSSAEHLIDAVIDHIDKYERRGFEIADVHVIMSLIFQLLNVQFSQLYFINMQKMNTLDLLRIQTR